VAHPAESEAMDRAVGRPVATAVEGMPFRCPLSASLRGRSGLSPAVTSNCPGDVGAGAESRVPCGATVAPVERARA